MTAPPDGLGRRLARATALGVTALAGSWALYLVVAGGFDATILGRRITTHEPLRPLLIAALAFSLFILTSGHLRPSARWLAPLGRIDPRWLAGGLTAATVLVGIVYSTTAASGSDAYGYVSQADLWLEGDLKIDQPWVEQVPWPSRRWAFSPLGYRPLEEEGEWAIVPTYSAGLPLLMASAKLIGGHCALFWVVPLSGGVLVLATYLIGSRLGAPRSGLVAAWLVATSPVFLFMLMWPMTDVPVAAAWAIAFYFLLGETTASAAAAGLASAVAILIRPNLVASAGVFGLWYLIQAARAPSVLRLEHLRRAIVYGLCTLPGIAATAAINLHLYGSALTSGYGGLGGMFSRENVLPNLSNYFRWFIESQTELALIGLAAVALPLGRIWPGVRDRSVFLVIGLFFIVLLAQYMAYIVFEFETWWYLRFLLSLWPFIMLGLAGAGLAVARGRGPAVTALVTATLIGLGFFNLRLAAGYSAFELWEGEGRYPAVARLVRVATESNSVILAMQHSGSLRYYSGRTTVRFDNLDDGTLDESVAWLAERGVRSYLLVEDWEIPDFKRRFGSDRAAAHVDRPAIFIYQGGATILLFDLQHARDPDAKVDMFVETYDNLRCIPPVPRETLILK